MFITNQYGELFCKTNNGDEGFITKINTSSIVSTVEIRELESKDTFVSNVQGVSIKTDSGNLIPLTDAIKDETVKITGLALWDNTTSFKSVVHDRCDRFSYDVRVDENHQCCNFNIHFKNKYFEKVEFDMSYPYKEYQWKALARVPELIEHARKSLEAK